MIHTILWKETFLQDFLVILKYLLQYQQIFVLCVLYIHIEIHIACSNLQLHNTVIAVVRELNIICPSVSVSTVDQLRVFKPSICNYFSSNYTRDVTTRLTWDKDEGEMKDFCQNQNYSYEMEVNNIRQFWNCQLQLILFQ